MGSLECWCNLLENTMEEMLLHCYAHHPLLITINMRNAEYLLLDIVLIVLHPSLLPTLCLLHLGINIPLSLVIILIISTNQTILTIHVET